MSKKVLLILVDGMRPDAIEGLPEVERLKARAAYTMSAKTVLPSITLPCHMSLFHSTSPERHGTLTNIYAPQVRPIDGLFEVLAQAGLRNAFFYEWEQLRDIARPGSLALSYFLTGKFIGRDVMNDRIAAAAKACLAADEADFIFLYLGYTDWAGHAYGWMSEGYMDAMRNTWRNIESVLDGLNEDYTVIITADHGGHDKTHGTDSVEDMTIPIFLRGPAFEAGAFVADATILDIAPTVVKLMGVAPAEEWEGKALF